MIAVEVCALAPKLARDISRSVSLAERHAAADAIARIDPTAADAIAVLREMLSHENEYLAAAARESLVRLGLLAPSGDATPQ